MSDSHKKHPGALKPKPHTPARKRGLRQSQKEPHGPVRFIVRGGQLTGYKRGIALALEAKLSRESRPESPVTKPQALTPRESDPGQNQSPSGPVLRVPDSTKRTAESLRPVFLGTTGDERAPAT